MVSYRMACTLFFLSFKFQSNLKTPSSTSSNIFPIPSLVSFGRNKAKRKTFRRYKMEKNGEYSRSSGQNLRTAMIQLRLKLSSFLVTGSRCGTNASSCHSALTQHMQWRVQANKWQLSRVIKLTHGFRKQQHFSSHGKETHLAGLTRNKTGQCFLYPKALIAHECQTSFARN